jgi:hypothetical protein
MFATTDSLPDTVARFSAELEDETAPQMGVHTLSEFVYCRSAGIISVDSKQDDTGSELPRAPALGGLPTHDLDRIQAAIEVILQQLKFPIGWNVALWLAALFVCLVSTPLLLVFFSYPMLVSGRWLFFMLRDFRVLKKRLRIAERAAISEPDWELPHPQPINWWSLMRAGFVSVEKQEPLVDPQLRLAGKPWRVLHRKSAVYPVLRIKVEDEDEKHDPRREGRLHKQQLARIAAYAYLLNRCERADSSWAIVLFGSSDEGIAVPISDAAWMAFHNGLLLAREQIIFCRENPHLPPERNRAACIHCPLGRPKPLIQKTVLKQGVNVAPFGTENTKRDVYHSTCGDHYRWVPPHERAHELGLTR